MTYYLAIDIGASSGRHILGWLEDGKIAYEEIHRFANGPVKKGGELCWDFEAMLAEIVKGLKKCAELGKIPASVGIDTWGVDFVLLDESGKPLGNTVAYRDNRTRGMDEETFRRVPEAELYRRTGIAKQIFNTIFQLMAVKKKKPELLAQAKQLLLVPNYLHYRLCGVAKNEYTHATTSGLVNADAKDWDDRIIKACGFPREIFAEIVPPGAVLGNLTPEIQKLVGFDCKVVAPCTHDTASAVMALPTDKENTLYISSGTWSLMGVERLSPDCAEHSRALGFTNEGGYDSRYRYLKNIMGLWMIQSVKKELGNRYTFDELCGLAEKSDIPSLVDCNDIRFLAPESMIGELKKACAETGQTVPETPGELAAVVYDSLANCYKEAAEELEELTGQKFGDIHIVGGGSKDAYLNRLTAKITGKNVIAGPAEATAIGNLMAQMIAAGELKGLAEGRKGIIL
jgi:rhamnulokinase